MSHQTVENFGAAGNFMQYNFRLVAYINTALLAAVLLVLAPSAVRVEQEVRPPLLLVDERVLLVVLFLSALNLFCKIYTLASPGGTARWVPQIFACQRSGVELSHLPRGFYGADDYAIPSMVAPLQALGPGLVADKCLVPARGKGFGLLLPLKLDGPQPAWISTNIQVFPWNHLLLNGVQIEPERLRRTQVLRAVSAPPLAVPAPARRFLCCHDAYLALKAEHGTTLSYAFAPDAVWQLLNVIAFPVFSLWLLGSAAGSIIALKGCISANAMPARQPQEICEDEKQLKNICR